MMCISRAAIANRSAQLVHALCFGTMALFFASCGNYPDIVETSADVRTLNVRERSIRARGLPDEDIHLLGRLRSLELLDFGSGWGVKPAQISDRGLEVLASLRLEKLSSLNLSYNENIKDAGLEHVRKLRSLDTLVLGGCPNITDDGLSAIARIRALTSLNLMGCDSITDDGLLSLVSLRKLRHLNLDGFRGISAQGVEQLQRRMPRTFIGKDDAKWEYLQR